MSVHFSESAQNYGYNFITAPFIPEGKDEYYLRNEQYVYLCTENAVLPINMWRNLKHAEIIQLEKQGNTSSNWQNVLVSQQFDIQSVRNSSFYGLVRIGNMGSGLLRFHDFAVPEGITNSRIISCDIGDHCAIHNCAYISHYIIHNNVILSSIGELDTTNHSKFGAGIIKDGEDETVRTWIDPLNEAGGRSVLPFYDMICADAYMWAIYRDDTDLMNALLHITQQSVDARRGFYGFIGSGAVIKNCLTIKDVWIEESAYIKGANKLKNLYIKSSDKDATQIGEGVELVNGIIGYGCRIFYGSKAVRFVMGNNSNLKYGARLIHSILGDNSTISCCEVLNNLVFPAHEQHHNNSFLIASLIMGQSNMAAGATVGSNHNSRGNDGEIIAGRGFWPGLSSTLKHNCRFASFTLITKGNYPHELHIPLPFSMLIESTVHHRLEVMPAYWWMYNMYALERNNWKYTVRDKRVFVTQRIETKYLAPDTVSEIFSAIRLLELWTGKAAYVLDNQENKTEVPDDALLCERGRSLLCRNPEAACELEIFGENMERSKRKVKIIKAAQAYSAYRDMLLFYSVQSILTYCDSHGAGFTQFQKESPKPYILAEFEHWVNLGGQLVREVDFNRLCADIKNGTFVSWQSVHAEYERLWEAYPLHKAIHALYTLYKQQEITYITGEQWNELLTEAIRIRRYMEEQIYKTKAKDYNNIFRDCTYRNTAERNAVIGTVENNSFIQMAQKDTAAFIELAEKQILETNE